MSTYTVPLENTPQSFQINLAGVDYSITCKWDYMAGDNGLWMIDIGDATTGKALACSIPLVTGVDLLDGLEYLGIHGQLYVYTDGNPYADPTLDNLGDESNLYFYTTVS